VESGLAEEVLLSISVSCSAGMSSAAVNAGACFRMAEHRLPDPARLRLAALPTLRHAVQVMATNDLQDGRIFSNFIGGEWRPCRSGEVFENRNPADRDDLIGRFQQSAAGDAADALDAAARAFDSWRLVPAPARAGILLRAAQLIAERKEQFAHDMTREMGKVLDETRGDVQEAIDMTSFMAGEGRRLYGQTVPSELPDKFAMSIRQPLGVCSLITPWNFPMAIPSWKIAPALV